MAVYRAALIWILRASAAAVLVLTTLTFVEGRRAYREAAAAYDQVEAAGLYESALATFLPAVAAAILCLSLAEILALLVRQAQK